MTQQRRHHSFVESCINVSVGFGVSFLGNMLILPYYGMPFHLWAFIQIGAWFTIISVIRSYYIRRLFVMLHDKEILR
jgi:hypothetical protein